MTPERVAELENLLAKSKRLEQTIRILTDNVNRFDSLTAIRIDLKDISAQAGSSGFYSLGETVDLIPEIRAAIKHIIERKLVKCTEEYESLESGSVGDSHDGRTNNSTEASTIGAEEREPIEGPDRILGQTT